MLKKKSFLSILFMMLMILSLVACGDNDQSNVPSDDENNEPSVDETDEPEEVTLKWLVPSIDQPDQERVWAEFNERLQEYLPNTTVEFENVTIPEYAERWQLVASAQEPVDIAWSFWNTPLIEEVEKGAYLDLTDLIPEYAPDLEKELDPYLMDFGKVDERQYAIPNWQPMTDMRVTMRTNQEDFDEFWSVEEAESVFYSREERPLDQAAYDALADYFQKILDARGEIEVSPDTLDQMQQGQEISGPFSIRIGDENFEVVNKIELPEMKLFFENMRDWNEKGFIREDILANPDGSRSEDHYIHFHAYFPGEELGNHTAADNDPDVIRTQFVPLTDEYTISQLIHNSNTVIPSSSPNPERALQLIELMHTEKGIDLFNFLLWGIEGEHYEVVEEGKRIETIGYPGEFPANPGSEADYGLTHYFTGNTLNAWETQANPEGHWETMAKLHDEAWKSPLIGFKPDLDPIRTEMAQIQTIYTEYWDTLYTGSAENWEELYDQMIERMNGSGAQTVIEELQSQVDAYVEEHDL